MRPTRGGPLALLLLWAGTLLGNLRGGSPAELAGPGQGSSLEVLGTDSVSAFRGIVDKDLLELYMRHTLNGDPSRGTKEARGFRRTKREDEDSEEDDDEEEEDQPEGVLVDDEGVDQERVEYQYGVDEEETDFAGDLMEAHAGVEMAAADVLPEESADQVPTLPATGVNLEESDNAGLSDANTGVETVAADDVPAEDFTNQGAQQPPDASSYTLGTLPETSGMALNDLNDPTLPVTRDNVEEADFAIDLMDVHTGVEAAGILSEDSADQGEQPLDASSFTQEALLDDRLSTLQATEEVADPPENLGSNGGPKQAPEGGPKQAPEGDTVLESPLMAEVTVATDIGCQMTMFGCCRDVSNGSRVVAAHGPNQAGCCLLSPFGCCPDEVTPASGKNFEGCDCKESLYGCCGPAGPEGPPDAPPGTSGVSSLLGKAAKGPNKAGCGCLLSPFGCCPDRYTPATDPDPAIGCPCHTHLFGCCPDGVKAAKGPHKEGCDPCSSSPAGCCPDNLTPVPLVDAEDPCGCWGSEHGCCPDGLTKANGSDFQGCGGDLPGLECDRPKPQEGDPASGPAGSGCGEDFSIRWFFDAAYGGCSKFWSRSGRTCDDPTVSDEFQEVQEEAGGIRGGDNRFQDLETCEKVCVKPSGSGRCYLPRASGPCKAMIPRWHYDRTLGRCQEFTYGGCLGNNNNFETMEECRRSCQASGSGGVAAGEPDVCLQPVEPGPCRGEYPMWHYDPAIGECRIFNYTGCGGNRNRFFDAEACRNSCRHKAKVSLAARICRLPKQAGVTCRPWKSSRWYFDPVQRRCRAFYFGGCNGNENNFGSREECEGTCPDTYPPEIRIPSETAVVTAESGASVTLRVQVEANPPPTVTWTPEGRPGHPLGHVFSTGGGHADDGVGTVLPDGSLVLHQVSTEDSGVWTVSADNGLGGGPVLGAVTLKVNPKRTPLQVEITGNATQVFPAGGRLSLTCQATGYPAPVVRWFKNNTPLLNQKHVTISSDGTLVIAQSGRIDSGTYKCRATNQFESADASVKAKVEDPLGESAKVCVDKPQFARCDLIVRANYCNKNKHYREFCCKSCTESGQLR